MAHMRGLTNFISEVRKCSNREEEQARVDKELANIRKHFAGARETAYDRKKYTWKLIYIFMLGYEVDFGLEQIKRLLTGTTFAEKVAGYMAVSVLIGQQDESLGSVCAAIREDLRSTFDSVQCMALSAVANKGGKRMGAALAPDVRDKTFSVAAFPPVRRRAAMALLRVYRVDPDYLPMPEYAPALLRLQEDKDVSVKMAGLVLMTGVAAKNPELFEPAVPGVVRQLAATNAGTGLRSDFVYHHTNAPWHQVQCLRFLQLYGQPQDAGVASMLGEVLGNIMTRTAVTKSVNKNNAEHAVLFETMNLIIKWGADCDAKLRGQAVQYLTKFVNIKEPNIRYLGLVAMTKLCGLPGTQEVIKRQQPAVLVSLKDADLSIRRRALDLLFAMCDRSNAMSIVKELLNYLAVAEFHIKQEMVLRLAILAERFAPHLQWYVDTIIQLVSTAGDFVSDDIWHRVVYIVTNNKDLQAYAARKLYRMVETSAVHETAVKLGGYILGEFGFLLISEATCGDVADGTISGGEQFAALVQHLDAVQPATKALLLTTFLKFQNSYPALKPEILPLFEKYSAVMDAELQQRAVEYFHLPLVTDAVTEVVLAGMPDFPEQTSGLEKRLAAAGRSRADTDAWGGAAGTGAGEEEGTPTPPTVAEEAPVKSPAPEEEEDLLAMTAPAPAPASALPTQASVRVGLDTAAPLREWFFAFGKASMGPLYADAHVRIEAAVAVSGEGGKVTLKVSNLTTGPFNLLKVRVPTVPYMTAAVGEAPAVVQAGESVLVPIVITSMRPFGAPADLQVSFLSSPSNGHAYPLRLPIFPTHFLLPVSVTKEAYGQRWRALKSEAGAAPCAAPSVAAAASALKALNFAETLTDASAVYVAASYKTATVSGATGEKLAVGCLAKVAVTAEGYAVEVRTQHPDVSKALFNTLKAQLA